MNKKFPALQFYVGDWRKDPGVQALDYHDRGVWFEMLCLMHESEQKGVLILHGKPMPSDALARTLGLPLVNPKRAKKSIRDLTTTLHTLLEYGVASKDEEGAIYCRRMVRDAGISVTRKNCGKMGGNPNLVNKKNDNEENLVNQNSNQKPPPQVNQNPTPSFSSSFSSSSSDLKNKKKDENLSEIPSWDEWWAACEMQGIPEAFARNYFEAEDEKSERWQRFAWRKRVPRVKKWFTEQKFNKIVNEKGEKIYGQSKISRGKDGENPRVSDFPNHEKRSKELQKLNTRRMEERLGKSGVGEESSEVK